MTTKKFQRQLSILKKVFAELPDYWLVGGAARKLAGIQEDKKVKDFDIIVPVEHEKQMLHTCLALTMDSDWQYVGETYFKGLKLEYTHNFDDKPLIYLDIWSGDVGQYLRSVPTAFDGIAVSMKNDAILRTIESYKAGSDIEENFVINTRPTIRPYNLSRWNAHLRNQGLGSETEKRSDFIGF